MTGFFLDQDSAGHWYIVPIEKSEEWTVWSSLDEDDERSWESPEWAVKVNMHPNMVVFEAWGFK